MLDICVVASGFLLVAGFGSLFMDAGKRCAEMMLAEFRARAVEVAQLRERAIRQVAQRVGIGESCLQNWMARPTSTPATSRPDLW